MKPEGPKKFSLETGLKYRNDWKLSKSSILLLCFAKYYLYINKLAPKDLSLDEFKARINWSYDFEKPLPSIS